jgi:hypothetical protein
MYTVRDVFHLKFGKFQEAKALFDDAKSKNMFPESSNMRILSDFTGHSYRLILENDHKSLADYEKEMSEGMGKGDWKTWYEKFKPLVHDSYREILKKW